MVSSMVAFSIRKHERCLMQQQSARTGWRVAASTALMLLGWGSGIAEAAKQTPWKSNAYGTLVTDLSQQIAGGYHFTPLVDGQITALGGLYNGTKVIKLFNKNTGALLASTTVPSANAWTYRSIAAVPVAAGTTYTVAVYVGSGGGARYAQLTTPLPKTFGDIRIEGGTKVSTATNPAARPTRSFPDRVFGLADIQFVPAPRISDIRVTEIIGSRVAIEWTTDLTAMSQVEYGLTTAYGQQTMRDNTLTRSHRVVLEGLTGLKTYHFRVKSKRGRNIAISPDQTFSTTSTGPSLMRVSGRQLLVRRRQADGSLGPEAPYIIRGVDWSPASTTTNTSPTDRNNANIRRPEFGLWYQTDIPLMRAMNVNTVRLFIDPGFDSTLGPVGRQVLDELYRNGIMVIMTVDDAINDLARVHGAINYYQDHPAILMWSIGSEWNINRYFGVAPTVPDAAQRTETAAALVKTLDQNHPVVSSYGEININSNGLRLADTQQYVNVTCPSVDVWSLNLYRCSSFWPVFRQWPQISTKPMFIAEFGTDAYYATIPSNPAPPGAVDEQAQADWVVGLWNDIANHLSGKDPQAIALGGTVFAWNDEWWKISPPGSQQTGGWFSSGFPDGMGNEEFFGIVDINRTARKVHAMLKQAFDSSYAPSPSTALLGARSRGANISNSVAAFSRDCIVFYSAGGGGHGGRGFNLAVIDEPTGELLQPVQNFDTWGTDMAKRALVDQLNALSDGTLFMLAVADEAGITYTSCSPRADALSQEVRHTLTELGSTMIQNYCWRSSWAMIARKGDGVALAEGLARESEVSVKVRIDLAP